MNLDELMKDAGDETPIGDPPDDDWDEDDDDDDEDDDEEEEDEPLQARSLGWTPRASRQPAGRDRPAPAFHVAVQHRPAI